MAEAVTLRAYAPADNAAVAALLGELGYPCTPDAVAVRMQRMQQAGGYECHVACGANGVCGVLQLRDGFSLEHDENFIHVLALVVAENMRGQGIGRALMQLAAQRAIAAGAARLLVNSGLQRTDAHAFYRSMGYAQTGLRFVKTLSSEPAVNKLN